MKIEITPMEQQIIVDSLRDRIGKLFDMQLSYKKVGNREAQMDCVREGKAVTAVLLRFNNMTIVP